MTTRRALLISTASSFAATLLLDACGVFTSTTTGNVTTITVDVTKLNAWGQAWVSGAKLIAGLPGIAGTPAAALINGVSTAILADLQTLASTTGTMLTLTFDSTSVPSAVASLGSDGQTLLADAQASLAGVAQASLTLAQTYINAVQTLVSLFQAAVGTQTAVSAMKALPMSEAQALAVLKAHG